MDTISTDSVFGEMKYRHRWYKTEQMNLFGTDWEITVAAKAYSGKPIVDAQRNSYKEFLANKISFGNRIAELITEFINQNCEELSMTWMGARIIKTSSELADIVSPKTVLFKQDGTTLVLFDCPWDEEHGLAVQLIPEFAIGSQDIFL